MIRWVEQVRRQAVRWAGEGVDLLFPPRCVFCRRDLEGDGRPSVAPPAAAGMCCAACDRDLSPDSVRCLRCGEAAADLGGDGCRRCRGRRLDWGGITVLSGYGDHLRQAILRAKHPAGDEVAHVLATMLVRRHRETFAGWRIDGVAPVPMHWLRRAARGTSAADEIGWTVARLLGVPFVSALARFRPTPMQNELPVHERRGNVQAAFRLRRRVAGRRLLLVDDVVTTGSTLAACSRTLANGGAESVFAAALAKADRSVDDVPRAD